jgi:hypothetical protein
VWAERKNYEFLNLVIQKYLLDFKGLTNCLQHIPSQKKTIIILQAVKEFPHVIEPEGTVPCSQKPAPYFYPETVNCSPRPSMLHF